MIGGPKSYGAGGYQKTPLEETLPVDMGVRDRQKQPDIALVVVIDKSGSMDACHCNTFNGGMGGGSGIGGVRKVDIGKEAILRAAAALTERDELGVVAFNEAAHWVVQTQPLGGDRRPPGPDRRDPADGQTNIFAGPRPGGDSRSRATTATRRHIILLTDGWSTSGQYDAILAQMKAAGITLSTVGAGGGANPFLEQLAKQGGGRFYAATNPASIPDIFLKETQQVSGQQIVEETFFPIQTSSLADPARPRGRPARSSAATTGRRPSRRPRPSSSRRATIRSSPSGSTASAGRSPGRPTRPGAGRRTGSAGTASPGSSASSSAGRSRARRPAASRRPSRRPAATTALHVESVERRRLAARLLLDERERSSGRTSSRATVDLVQVAPGRLRGAARRDRAGRLRGPGHPDAAGVVAARADGRAGRADRGRVPAARRERAVPRLAAVGDRRRGRSRRPLDPWLHDLTATDRFTDLWPLLLVLALLLWPLDIALRRMSLGRRELAGGARLGRRDRAAATGRRAAHRDRRGPAGRERPGPDERRASRDADCGDRAGDRAQRRGGSAAATPRRSGRDPRTASARPPIAPHRAAPPAARPAATVPGDSDRPRPTTPDTMARLRDAKRRARDR